MRATGVSSEMVTSWIQVASILYARLNGTMSV